LPGQDEDVDLGVAVESNEQDKENGTTTCQLISQKMLICLKKFISI